VALGATFLLPLSTGATDIGHGPREFLTREAGFTGAELSALDHGRVVAKTIDTSDRLEVVSLAALRVRATLDRARQVLLDVDGRRRDSEVLEIGRIPESPTAHDLGSLTLDPGDLDSLKKCKVGDCNERLPADAIERFQAQVDWRSADRAAKANSLWQETLAGYAQAYLARGDAGLVEYADNREPGRIARDLRFLLLRSYYLKESSPELDRYLSDFPRARPDNTTDVFYYLKERFWLKSVQSLNHLSLVETTSPTGRALFAATKQLFANHFFAASLSLTAFVESREAEGSYLIFVNRTRADIRPSGFNWLERALVRRLVRGRLITQFRALKVKLDPGYQPPDSEE
jgi:hypothetical protein